jgi:hypothetical protein
MLPSTFGEIVSFAKGELGCAIASERRTEFDAFLASDFLGFPCLNKLFATSCGKLWIPGLSFAIILPAWRACELAK